MADYGPSNGTTATQGFTSSTTLLQAESNEAKTPRNRSRQLRINTSLFLSTFLVVLVTSGLGALMVYWFVRHGTQSGVGAPWKDGAFLLDEGTRLEGGFEAARLTGLTIASATAIAMNTVMPILISLYAYRASYVWMNARREDCPTPLQFGLITESLSALGFVSLFNTAMHVAKTPRTGRPLSYVLKEVFCVCLVSYTLVHLTGALDLWLHITSATVNVQVPVQISPDNFSVTQSACHPYDIAGYNEIQTLEDLEIWQNNNAGCSVDVNLSGINEQGMLLALNESDTFTIKSLQSAQGLSVLITPDVTEGITFNMTTYGARANCESIVGSCTLDYTNKNGSCSDAPSEFILVLTSGLSTTGSAQSVSYPILPNSSITGNVGVFPEDNVLDYPINTTGPGGYTIFTQLSWPIPTEFNADQDTTPAVPSFLQNSSVILVTADESHATLITACNVSYYNVTLGYNDGNYSAVEEQLADRFLSDGFSVPLRADGFTSYLLDDLQPIFFSPNMTDEDRMKTMSQQVSQMAIASAGMIANLTSPALSQYQVENRVLGRYPVAPVILLLLVLFLNSLFAVAICLATSFSYPEDIDVPEMVPASPLELARLRLASPLAQIAERYPPSHSDTTGVRGELMSRTSALEMFAKTDGRCVRVGVHKDKGTGETFFGTWIEDTDWPW